MGRVIEALTLSAWYDNGVLTSKRMIYLEGVNVFEDLPADEVTTMMANKFIKSMCLLEALADRPEDEITIIMNTQGGDEFAGNAIYDRIMESPCHVNIRCYGSVMSMGTIILQAGDTRQLTPNTWVMIHGGEGDAVGSTRSIINWGTAYKVMEDRSIDIYYEQMKEKDDKISKRKIRDMLKVDNIFTAQEAVDMGLADEIYTGEPNGRD